jgi:hypothetical protein
VGPGVPVTLRRRARPPRATELWVRVKLNRIPQLVKAARPPAAAAVLGT